MDTKWLDANQAAALLNQTPDQILSHGLAGRVRMRRDGRHAQYRRADIEALVAELAGGAPAYRATVAPEVGRALVETLGMARELIETQRQLLAAQAELADLRAEVARLQTQRRRYIEIIGALQKRSQAR